MGLSLNITKCIYCNKEFERFGIAKKFCSQNCVIEKHKSVLREKQEGIEGVDYIICHLCNSKVQRIYGKHLEKFHKISSEEYKKLFPESPLCCDKDLHNISVNSGKHMKEEKYRQMVSKQMMGENNINSKTKTDEITRQGRSPFSQVFYERLNKPAEDRAIFVKRALKDRIAFWELQYFINKGMSEEEAKIFRKSKKFSLVYCINKYGEEEGLGIWKDRQIKWQKNYKHSNYSKISQILFKSIYGIIKDDFNSIFFAEILDNGINNEYNLELNNKIIKPDFFVKDVNKIIEFDGVYWHRSKPENVKRELERDLSICENGYNVLHINESDYYKNPEEIIKKCVDFIYEK